MSKEFINISAADNGPILEIKDLNVIYKTDVEVVHAVNGISLSLEKGETIGLVGETGAGKTTTALAILQLLPERTGRITEGSIRFLDREITEMSEKELELVRGNMISMIFQDPMTSLNPVLRIDEQIGEAVMIHNPEMSKAQINDRVEEVLGLVGIPASRKNEYPHQFSGGMKQRVVIAIALSCNPMLLIADEPTTALDVTIQAQVLALIEELQEKQDTSMIMITHDLGVVASTCDKVGIMYAGELVEFGTLEDIFDSEKHHPYTSGLFNAIPDLTVETKRLNAIDGLMPDPTMLPEGCAFAPRCHECMEICRKQKPGYYQEGGHSIKCFLYVEQKQEENV